jgi:hypothetical protein
MDEQITTLSTSNLRNHKLGTGTPSSRLKGLFRKEKTKLSFKQFVRALIKDGNEDGKAWFLNKSGKLNAKRSDANKARVQIEKQKTREARRKGSKGGSAS